MSLASDHAREVRERLRNPPNAVKDMGIDLKREKFQLMPIRQAEPVVEVVEVVEPLLIEDEYLVVARQIRDLNAELERLTQRKEFITQSRRPPVEAIQRAVCEHFNISLMDLLSPRRDKPTCTARQVAMYLAKNLTTQSLPQIGRRFGGRDHTTVLHAVRKITNIRPTRLDLDSACTAIADRFALPTL